MIVNEKDVHNIENLKIDKICLFWQTVFQYMGLRLSDLLGETVNSERRNI